MYTFRIRFTLPDSIRLGIDEHEWEIALAVTMRAVEPQIPIRDAAQIAIHGGMYSTHDEATREGNRWRDTLQAAFARIGVGVNFGDRSPRSVATEAGLALMSLDAGCRVINSEPGVSVFTANPKPKFAHCDVSAVKILGVERMKRSIRVAYDLAPHHTSAQTLAYDLYSASFFTTVADARMLMLMMAVETLIEPEERSSMAVAHVRSMIDLTKESDLPPSDKASILGSLRWLTQESISQAGKRLANGLEGQTYMGLSPDKFFNLCYDLRSRLAHGAVPRPSFSEVNMTNGPLEQFVGNLLCPKLMHAVPD